MLKTDADREERLVASQVWWWLLGVDLISVSPELLCPRIWDPHLLLSPVCSHIDSYVTSQGDRGHNTSHTASGAASPHLNCLGGAGASLAAACVIVTSGESRDGAKHEQLIHVACYLHCGRCARWKVLVRVQNMRRILKRNTFYNL